MFIAAALVLGGLTLIFTFNAARDVREQVRTSTEMLSDVRAVQRSVTDAETGQRGYLLTGNDIYLEPFFEGQENCGPALDRLEQRLGSEASPEQSQAVARLRTLSNAKFAELAQTIEYARQGNRPAALQLVQTNEGLELMRQIRATIEKLETDEERALAASIAKAEETESNTRLILTFLAVFLVLAMALGLWLVVRTARAEASMRDVIEVRRARERADLLARELNHRVKNLFAVVSSIVGATVRSESDVEIAADKAQSRIRALAIAHEVTQGTLDRPIIELDDLVDATLAPYEQYHDRLSLAGPSIPISTRTVTPLGLVLHELATNALKYGAWSNDAGQIAIDWSMDGSEADEAMVKLAWQEEGITMPAEAPEDGFGTRMLKLAAAQLNGTIDRKWTKDGTGIVLSFPQVAP